MDPNRFYLWPQQASTHAAEVDALFTFIMAVTVFFTLLIFVLIMFFALKYNRRRGAIPVPTHTSHALEIGWSVIPLLITLVMFAWGSAMFISMQKPPANAMEIHVMGKQWMWKLQHPEGRREINELHVPLGQPVRLVMISQDVIHSFGLPAFRLTQDVLPGRYTTEWFTANKTGEFGLFCREYCGSQHSAMIGKVVVMEPSAYESWLANAPAEESMVASGAKLFSSANLACNTCHGERAPTMAGLFGRTVQLADGRTIKADEEYLRRSILNPSADIVAGYPPLMPAYEGRLSEEQLSQLIEYIKSLHTAATQDRDSGTLPNQPTGAGQQR
jgi:cytochrome c oxidase subunit 2